MASPITSGEPATGANLRVVLRRASGGEVTLGARDYGIAVMPDRPQCEDFLRP